MKQRILTKALGLAALGAAVVGAPQTATADYPSKPIKLYVGFSAGGGTDATARGFASYVHEVPEMNGMPMVVVNKPGGSGVQAALIVKDAEPDGYTIKIINSGTFAAADMANSDSPVNPREDFTSLGCATRLVTALFVHASSPYNDAGEWVKAVKDSGETIRWGTSGAVTLHALIGHLTLDAWGVPHVKVPFKGGSRARAAMIAQKTDAMYNGVHNQKGFEADLKAIGVPLVERDPANKNVPTFAESGLDGFNVAGSMCFWGPKGMPDDVVAKLQKAVEHVTGLKGFNRYLGKSALAPIYISGPDALANLNTLYDVLGPVVENAGLKR